MPRYFALIPAAGVGSRMQADVPKQYLPLRGRPMLAHAIDCLAGIALIQHVFVVVSADDPHIGKLELPAGRVSVLPVGGATRQQSVRNGLQRIDLQYGDQLDARDWILVHDAARPGLTPTLVQRLIDGVGDDPVGGLLALPIADTVKRADDSQKVQTSVPRDGLWAAQTPQMFRHQVLRRALEAADDMTDESSAVEALGLRPLLVAGSLRNMKVTRPEDVAMVENFMDMPQ